MHWSTGDKATWYHHPRGGWGYPHPIAARIEAIGQRAIRIRIARRERQGPWQHEQRWVPPASLGPRTHHIPILDGQEPPA